MKKIYLIIILQIFLLISFLTLPLKAAINYEWSEGDANYQDNWYYSTNQTIEPVSDPEIIFPVEGGATFINDFGDARSSGRTHEANDLMAPKMTRILAAQSGIITFAPREEPSYGYVINIAGDDGYKYNYLHINNDTPGTDDGQGGPENAYLEGITHGVRVEQGQPIAFVGDSGNAESTASHLHFEIRLPDNSAINPYPYLIAALERKEYDIEMVKAASPDINADKSLIESQNNNCQSGDLIKTNLTSTIYYCGADGKRYVFPNDKTYFTWYDDFSMIKTITLKEISNIPLAGNVTYRPGIRLIKIQSDPRVYAVEKNGTLRLLPNPQIAEKYYGKNWTDYIDDVPDAFFTNYHFGESINS